MDTDVYMEPPALFQETLQEIATAETDDDLAARARQMLKKLQNPDKICRLNKALYGLRQAGRQWHAELHSVLEDLKFISTNADPCVYVDEGKLTFILIYVDDILIVSNDQARVRQIKDRLSRSFRVKDLGEAKYCLGIEINRDREGFSLSQAS